MLKFNINVPGRIPVKPLNAILARPVRFRQLFPLPAPWKNP